MHRFLSPILFIALLSLCNACKGEGPDDPGDKPSETPVELKLVDSDATPETKALYSNLWAIKDKGWMFGHQADLVYGRSWQYTEGGSDTKAVCGDYPGVFALDIASFIDGRKYVLQDTAENPVKRRCIKEAYDRGMVVMFCMHINNPLTGGDSWDNSSKMVAAEILRKGSDTQILFDSWLDELAGFSKSLRNSSGKLMPAILRPFHEHAHDWSWWGGSCTTADEYIALWRYLVDGLKARGVHNFIYASSPAMNNAKVESDFLYRWPGDDYVDFMGMDCYLGINNNIFLQNLKALRKVSEARRKPAGVTEIGVQGFTNRDYWIENIAAPMAGRKMSMLVTWTNEYDPLGSHNVYFSVYPGHVSEDSFRTMYDRSDTFFCRDLPDMYVSAENIIVE